MTRPLIDPESPSPLRLETARLALLLPRASWAPRVLDYFRRNEAYHAPWSPDVADDFLTLGFWRRRLTDNRAEFEADVSLRLFVEERATHDIVGTCSFTHIQRGPFLACYLGYTLDQAREGRGYMTEALRAAIPHVFDDLGLHRIMAAYMPDNTRSARVLERLGFLIEGTARDYLFLHGRWRDHVLTSLTNPRPMHPGRTGTTPR